MFIQTLQGFLATKIHDEVAANKIYQTGKEKMSVFLIVEKWGFYQD